MLEIGKLYRINYDPVSEHHVRWNLFTIPSMDAVLLFLNWEVSPFRMSTLSRRIPNINSFLSRPLHGEQWYFEITFKFLWEERLIKGSIVVDMPEHQKYVIPRCDSADWYVSASIAQEIWESYENYLPTKLKLFKKVNESFTEQGDIMLDQ